MAAPPTVARGHVSSYDYATMLDELTVDTPSDLMWPTSIQTYATMRRDSRLTAILAGYGLQLRRAQWQLDGTGCRPEVVQQVADDLGLPIKGRDEPTAARVRGVSWHEHLRAALLAHVYGHSGFELSAKIVDGRARLFGLFERPPWTVGDIHVDPKSGAFLGITQESPAAARKPPQIGADRMCWYAREREGANWAGTSLLRASFPAWLIRREMMRVHATANRRFGMGVPNMEALPGTSPSPAQMAEAMQMASAARVGDQAGSASPPGFVFKLVGLSGGVPDTLAFIEFLGREMATSVLMQHLDLGTGETGSRALGVAFIDNWMLALGTEADQVADTATRQTAARIVGWNWGDTEPVPAVVASGIGAKREVTAESLDLLLSSGALSADPRLEEWVRREYRLPERDGTPAVAPSTPTVAAQAGRRQRAPRRARKESSGQLSLPIAAAASREPTDAEQQSGANFEAIAADIEQAQQELAEQWPGLSEAMIAALVAAVIAAVAAGTLDELGSLAVPDDALVDAVTAVAAAMVALAATSAGRAAEELRGQGVTINDGVADADRLQDAASAFVGVIASGYATGAGRVALQYAGPDVDPDTVGDAVREHLDSLSATAEEGSPAGWVSTNLGGALAQAVHDGRVATFEGAPAGTRFMISAANDRNVCKPCSDDDQRVFDTLAEALEICPASGNKACLGGIRCRCEVLALAADEEE